MPTPTSNRPRSRVVTSGAKAATREPRMKMSPVKKMTLRRPNRSESPPAKAAPTAAPASAMPATSPCMPAERAKSVRMKRSAPEITPVS